MVWPMDRVQQIVIAKLSLRLSLNNPSNIWHCSNEICHKTAQREREREKKKGEKRKRASELDAKWYGNCKKQGTTGWISLIHFAHSVNVQFNGLLCMVPGYRLSGGPYRFAVFRAHLWQKKN